MSLNPNDDRRRGRSKSPGGGRRERSRSRVDEYAETKSTTRERSRVRTSSSPSIDRYDDRRGYDYDERKSTSSRADVVTEEPRGSSNHVVDSYRDPRGSDPRLSDPRLSRDPRSSHGSLHQYHDASPSRPAARGYAMPGGFDEEKDIKVQYGTGRGRDKEYSYEKKKFSTKDDLAYGESPPREYGYSSGASRRDERTYDDDLGRGAGFSAHAGHHSISGGISVGHGGAPQYVQAPEPSAYQVAENHGYQDSDTGRKYGEVSKYEYAKPSENIRYSSAQETTYGGRAGNYAQRPSGSRHGSYQGRESRSHSEVDHEDSSRRSSQKLQATSVEPGRRREPSPARGGLAPRMHSLSVSTGHHGSAGLSLATAPGSPLLESYHGTYQSISPMPSPLMMPAHGSDVNYIDALSPYHSSSESDHGRKSKPKRTARFHDPFDEATILAKALQGEKRAPDTGPLVEILPGLTHEQVLDLRVEYKQIVKTGREKKGVNVAKHIKMRLKDEDGSLMKACYACALGRWESEAFWANSWYHGEKSRRELLIESLMGRTNWEIREIKEGFSDKKYGDSLTKCMKMELKEDKFKKAVLLVLEERRMEDRDRDGYLAKIDRDLVEDDVRTLYKSVRSEKGGESAMIGIIVMRSDGHLREVLRVYEATYRANFAREMLKKSGNLVGEMLAHILNGVINKPVRDAMLLKHALSLSKLDALRTELLISRLVRYHWDRPHMELIKKEYKGRYGVDLQVAVKEGTRGEWGRFCEGLCMRRMADEVKRVDDLRR